MNNSILIWKKIVEMKCKQLQFNYRFYNYYARDIQEEGDDFGLILKFLGEKAL